ATAGAAPGRISSREDAFKVLLDLADFFRRTEPHSPLSYSLEQAVRWGRMPLPDLLSSLISNTGVRNEFFRVTGIPRPAETSNEDDDDD
ncbi:MAG: type VI secretion system protein TssA, partial [Gammaproteobacteria bacterium]